MTRNTSRKIVLATFILIALYPFQSQVVPAWRVQVVDEAGKPVPGMAVLYTWRHYGIEWSGDEEHTTTDAQGYVSFPPRTTRASLAQRTLRAITNVPYIVHASWEPHGLIVVYGHEDKYQSEGVSYSGKGTLPTKIVLEPAKPPQQP